MGSQSEVSTPVAVIEVHPAEPLPLTQQIDAAILEGRYAAALALCKNTASQSEESFPEWADRVGLCLEGLGQWEDAAAAYERALLPPSNAEVRARAGLGLVRCSAITTDLTAARERLNRLVLRSADPDVRFALLADCLMHRAWLDVLALGPTARPAPLVYDAVEWPSLRPPVSRYFEWQLTPRPRLVAKKTDGTPDVIEVTAEYASKPVHDLLRRITADVGLFVRIEPAAVSRLAGRTETVHVVDCPLSDLLTALTELHGLSWRIIGDTVLIATKPEQTDRLGRVDRSLGTAARFAPDHPAMAAVRISRANVAWLSDRVRDACDSYRRALNEAPHTPEATAAAYNLGLAELRLGNLGAAGTAFRECVDRSSSRRDTGQSWWWVGYSYLAAGKPESALAPLRTALADGSGEVASAAALTLGVCYQLLGQEDEARAVVRSYRPDSQTRHLVLARFFDALHRYQVRPSDGRAQELIDTLKEAENGRLLGTAGVFLAGKIYTRLGLLDQMAELYRVESSTAKGMMALQMTFAIAEREYELDRRASARERFLVVAEYDHEELGARAEFRLAELAWRDRHGAECVARCRALVGRAGVESADCLALMGRGYELRRMHRHAAECFAGRVPAE